MIRHPSQLLFCGLIGLIAVAPLKSTASPVISEFLALNTDSIRDEDGDRSDWIEIRNTSNQPVNLVGHSMTDDPAIPQKWVFPSRLLLGNAFLVVFASGKDRSDPGSELHTNFGLSGDGEDLLLFDPEGAVLSSFSPYPPQFENISYGEGALTDAVPNILNGAACRWLVPNGPVAGWNTREYDDSTWTSATTGIGFERSALQTYTPLISPTGDTEAAMYSLQTSVYLRIPFNIEDASAVTGMLLKVRYDDGFDAFINGQQVASDRAPENPDWQSAATADHDDADAVVATNFEIDDVLATNLVDGENILAIQGLNSRANNSDFLLLPEMDVSTSVLLAGSTGFHTMLTPGDLNDISVDGVVEDTKFSVDRGFFTSAFPLEITTDTDGAEIRYTTDGSAPTASTGTRYTGPVDIAETTVLRAAAFKEGFQPTNIDTQTYIFTSSVRDQPTMDPDITDNPSYSPLMDTALRGNIPTVSLAVRDGDFFGPAGIYTNSQNSGRAAEVALSVEYFTPSGSEQFQIDAGIRIHGGNARSHPKKPLRLYFRRDYGEAKLRYPLFPGSPVEEFDQLLLRGGGHDSWSLARTFGRANNDLPPHGTIMRDQFLRRTEVEMGILSPRGKYVHVYINGTYWGVYDLHERANEDFFASHGGGEPEDYDVLHHPEFVGQDYSLVNGSTTDWLAMQAIANAGVDTKDEYDAIQEYLDIDSFIIAMITRMWSGDYDWCGPIYEGNANRTVFDNKNWYAGRRSRDGAGPGDGKFLFFCWDAEMSMGLHLKFNLGLNDPQRELDFDLTRANDRGSPVGIYDGLRNYPEFQVRFGDLLQEHLFNDGAMSKANNLARFRSMEQQIENAMIAESARWGDEGGSANVFDRNGEWRSEVNWLKNSFIANRNELLISQFRARGLYPSMNAPSFSQLGGEVAAGYELALFGSGGLIYYTLDGSDPRLEGGGISPQAQLYEGAFPLGGPTARVRARIRASASSWSAIQDASFVVGQAASASNLAITEFHYHPASPSSPAELAVSADDEDYEFIEITNLSDSTVNLIDIDFTQGVQFTLTSAAPIQELAAGGRALVVANREAFLARYGASLDSQIIGQFEGGSKLSNNGESVTLSDAFGDPISSFTYADSAPWPSAADGEGPSLVLREPVATIDESLPSSWKPSVASGGTPGSPPISGFSGWVLAFFDPDSPKFETISAPGADPDADGLPNLVEYALGLSPVSADRTTEVAEPVLLSIRGRTFAGMTYRFSPGLEGVTMRVEASSDLLSWSSDSTIAFGDPVPQPDGSSRATVRTLDSYSTGAPIYLRLRVESAAE